MSKTSKPRIFTVGHAGYPFDVLVALGASNEQVIAAIKRRGIELDASDVDVLRMRDGGRGRTVMLGGGQTVLILAGWRGSANDFGCLAHEVFHAVDFLMRRVGIKLSRKSDEAYAYAVGNLTTRILANLR